ncbi:hypothetical protein HBE96_05120 [Clostridium sp. P21]|uniref:Uncharacterized protein n=1 Tax=Clostridium muellerianum TaxID=2716538 RepID=A0A7Y0EEL7_9CLOT|nr:hypothetical protein [Clostridium muellerianum]NMM62079.1 hypothetical protein [Clostridium muellerianum]
MYNLSIGLTYENLLQLSKNYRYDFLSINPTPGYGFGPLNSSIFVFRTIKESHLLNKKSINNVLIDAINYKNINGFDAAIHGDCHFHILDINNINEGAINLTDIISLKIIKDETGETFYATIKNQKIIPADKIDNNDDNDIIEVKQLKYILFKINNSDIINCKKVELAKIFALQIKDIWHRNRYQNFNNITNLDIDKGLNDKLDPSTSWEKAKELVEQKRKHWETKQDIAFNNLLTEKRSLDYIVLD